MRVAVIGAGAAGLATARELCREGLEVVMLERSTEVGGQWDYTERTESDPLGLRPAERVHSSIYASLRTNLPTSLMAFPDVPFPGDERGALPRFCGHREVQDYLLHITDAWALRPLIRFGREVVSIAPDDDAFVVHHRPFRGHKLDALRVQAVAMCNGHYSEPRVPALPGAFMGQQSHSHNYRRPDAFAGKRVAILGAKSSGTDLSRELAGVASEVYLCARTHPTRRRIAPRLVAAPAISALGPGLALGLDDGTRLEGIDHLLYCTGYRYPGNLFDARISPGWVQLDGELIAPLYLDLVVPTAPRLAFVGLPFGVAPFPLMQAQARFWAQCLSGTLAMPRASEMTREVETRRKSLERTPRRHWLRYGERQFAYVDMLRRRVGDPSLPPAFKALYDATHRAKQDDPNGYRDGTWRVKAPRL